MPSVYTRTNLAPQAFALYEEPPPLGAFVDKTEEAARAAAERAGPAAAAFRELTLTAAGADEPPSAKKGACLCLKPLPAALPPPRCCFAAARRRTAPASRSRCAAIRRKTPEPSAGAKRGAERELGDAEEYAAHDWRSLALAGRKAVSDGLTVDQLKVFLRRHGLPQSGKKSDLVERIIEHLGVDK